MAKKKVAKASSNDGREEPKGRSPLNSEDHQTANNLKSLNDLLVRQTMELRQQVAGLEKLKEKLEYDISQAEERAQVLMFERDSSIQKQMDSEEERRISSAILDIERMLGATIISAQVSQYSQENDRWERELLSYLQEAREQQEALQHSWRIEKEGLENAISSKEAKIAEMIELCRSIDRSWKLEKTVLEKTICSQETKISEIVKLKEAIEESRKTETEELRRTISALESETRRMVGINEESKKIIGQRDLTIVELLNDVARLKEKVLEVEESRNDLLHTNYRMLTELQQSNDGFSRARSDNEELNTMVLKLKGEIKVKDAQLKSLKEEMVLLEGRAAEWMKGYEGASALGEKVLCKLRRTAEMLMTSESGELMTTAWTGEEEDDHEGFWSYKKELKTICGAFKKETEKVHEMAQKIDSMTAELLESENRRRSMNMWHALLSTLTGAGAALTVALVAKLRS
ncbi:uncharacterized protein LOC116249712 [Nymphaea colorata]|uniref:uncharacterized protein LOC116249712 n=1 Tax=Nymphaea colorata TaxID=210225 RepID=UPI00129DC071|nr:uncharacterized protein LOC116249712 [Nymphaea colorata]